MLAEGLSFLPQYHHSVVALSPPIPMLEVHILFPGAFHQNDGPNTKYLQDVLAARVDGLMRLNRAV